jgi:hypothetical protein
MPIYPYVFDRWSAYSRPCWLQRPESTPHQMPRSRRLAEGDADRGLSRFPAINRQCSTEMLRPERADDPDLGSIGRGEAILETLHERQV